RESAPRFRLTLVNSVNPYRIEGQKTGAFEICDALGRAPDVLAIPVGNAGNITAYWRGFVQYHRDGRSAALPKMSGFQAAGAAPLALGHPVERPEAVAAAIRIGRPASRYGAVAAARDSAGGFEAVTARAVATSASLGPGFDALGLALRLYNTLTLEPADHPAIEIEGEGTGTLPRDTAHLAYQAALAVAARAEGGGAAGARAFRLRQQNQIPLSSGLGSSAAAIVGGAV